MKKIILGAFLLVGFASLNTQAAAVEVVGEMARIVEWLKTDPRGVKKGEEVIRTLREEAEIAGRWDKALELTKNGSLIGVREGGETFSVPAPELTLLDPVDGFLRATKGLSIYEETGVPLSNVVEPKAALGALRENLEAWVQERDRLLEMLSEGRYRIDVEDHLRARGVLHTDHKPDGIIPVDTDFLGALVRIYQSDAGDALVKAPSFASFGRELGELGDLLKRVPESSVSDDSARKIVSAFLELDRSLVEAAQASERELDTAVEALLEAATN